MLSTGMAFDLKLNGITGILTLNSSKQFFKKYLFRDDCERNKNV